MACQFLAFAVEHLSHEDMERQAALNRALIDTCVFKVHSIPNYTPKYRKIFDIKLKVQQKLIGYLAPSICSLATAKKVFDLETMDWPGLPW